MAASTFGRSQVGSTFANIGFAFETSGFQVDPLFFKVMEGEGMYIYSYTKNDKCNIHHHTDILNSEKSFRHSMKAPFPPVITHGWLENELCISDCPS